MKRYNKAEKDAKYLVW